MKKLLLTAGVVAVVSAGTAVGITLAVHHPKTKTVIQTQRVEIKDDKSSATTQASKVVDYSAMETAIRSFMINDENMKNYDYGVSNTVPSIEKTFQQFLRKAFGNYDFQTVGPNSFGFDLTKITRHWQDKMFNDDIVNEQLFKKLPTEFHDKFVEETSKFAKSLFTPIASSQLKFVAMQLVANQMSIQQLQQYMTNILDVMTAASTSCITEGEPRIFTAYNYMPPKSAEEYIAWLNNFRSQHSTDFKSIFNDVVLTLPSLDVVYENVHHNASNIRYKDFADFKNKVMNSDFHELKNIALEIPFFKGMYEKLVLINDGNVASKVSEIVSLDHLDSSTSAVSANDEEKAKKLYDKWFTTFMEYHSYGINDPKTTNMSAILYEYSAPYITYGSMVMAFGPEDIHLIKDYLIDDIVQRQRADMQASSSRYITYPYMDDKWDKYFSQIPYDRLKITLQKLTQNIGKFIEGIILVQDSSEADPIGYYINQLNQRGNDATLLLGRGHFNYNQFD